MIKIMIDFSSHKFNKIGSLAIDEDGKYYITKDIYIDAGPFKTAEEYYNALSLHRFHDFTKYHFRDNISAGNCPAIHLAFMFNNYMRIYTDCANYHSPFSLVYPGFGVHSIVLDKGNNIICVNNVENIMAAPMPIVTQLPRSHALDLPPLGRKIMFSRRNFESENGIPQYARFVKMFRAEEEQRNSLAPIANCMLSNGARLVEGLNKYSEMSINCSNEWVQNYKYMYHRRQTGKLFSESVAYTVLKFLLGKVGEKGVLKILTLDDDREPKVPAGASSLTGPYPEGGEIDDPEAEPESPQSLIVIRRKNIAAYLGLTEAQQQDVMHLHRALRMGSAPMISDTAAWEVLKTKLSMYDHDSVFQPMLVNQAADKPLFGKRSSSWMSNLFRSANKPLVSLQQPNPVKIARMRSLKKAFSSDTFRAPLPAPKTVNNIGRVPIPGRFPTTELETLGRDQTLLRADYAAGRDVTDESDSVVGGFAGLALDDDGETYHDAAVPQGERSHSAISDDMRPLL